MITVGLSTYDRREPFEATLWDLGKQDLSGLPEVELLVVLNNSPAQTQEIVDWILPDLPYTCRAIKEPTPGLNFARNRIIREARGDILVFTDDDLVRDSNWLQEMVKAFQDPEVSCVGGRIHPRLLCPLPPWFKYPRYDGIIVKYDLGDEPFFLDKSHPMPYGASMAFRSGVFRSIGLFREDLRYMPGSFVSGDETEYFVRALRSGLRIFYRPTAVSYHPIGEERLNKVYVRRKFYDWGTSWARMNFEAERSAPQWAGAPRHLYRSMLEHAAKWTAAALCFDGAACFLHANEMVYLREFAKEFRRLSADERNRKEQNE